VEDDVRITILCSKEFKLEVKEIAARKGFDRLNDAYWKIFNLGFEEFRKE